MLNKLNLNILFYLLLVLTMCQNGYAQETIKYETEENIDVKAVPIEAVEKIANFQRVLNIEKIKWVRETNFDRISYEAKGLWQGKPISIEFDSLGQFEDAEITVRLSSIEKETCRKIKRSLRELYPKYRLLKFQLQYSGNHSSVIDFMNNETPATSILKRFEIEVFAMIKTNWRSFELLFDELGNLLEKREINSQSLNKDTY